MEAPDLTTASKGTTLPGRSKPEQCWVGDPALLERMRRSDAVIHDVAIAVAKDGLTAYYRFETGGEWCLVALVGCPDDWGTYISFDRMYHRLIGRYVALKPGEVLTGGMSVGKNRTSARYSLKVSEDGVVITPVDRHQWGDRAYDITATSTFEDDMAVPERPRRAARAAASEPPAVIYTTANEEEGETAMERALREAGLL